MNDQDPLSTKPATHRQQRDSDEVHRLHAMLEALPVSTELCTLEDGRIVFANPSVLQNFLTTLTGISESEEKYRRIFELQSDAVFIMEGESLAIIDCNQAAMTMYGYTQEAFLLLRQRDLSAEPEDSAAFIFNLQDTDRSQHFERQHKRSDGTVFPVEGTTACFTVAGKKIFCSIVRDVSLRKRFEQALQESSTRFHAIAEASPLPLVISRLSDGCIVYANDKAESELLLSKASITGANIKEIFRNENQHNQIIEAMRKHTRVSDIEVSFRDRNKKKRWLSATASLITFLGEECVATGFIDVTESHQMAKQLKYQASHDSLTGLVNRREFEARLKRTLISAKRNKTHHVLCYLDLDKFKQVNDAAGHEAGDALLKSLSNRLRQSLRHRDTLARLGGDEFAVIVEHCSLEEALIVSSNLRKAIQSVAFSWHGQDFEIGVSIGLVTIDSSSGNASSVLKAADRACYAAKNTGRNRIHTFDPHT